MLIYAKYGLNENKACVKFEYNSLSEVTPIGIFWLFNTHENCSLLCVPWNITSDLCKFVCWYKLSKNIPLVKIHWDSPMKDRHPEKNLVLDDPDKHLKPLKTLLKVLKPRQYQEQCLHGLYLVHALCWASQLSKALTNIFMIQRVLKSLFCFQRFVKILH